MEATETAALREQIGELQKLLASLSDRLAKLEAAGAQTPAEPAPEVKSASETGEEEITEETILVLSAAVTAFLGKKVKIRRARRIRAAELSPWAQQGRVFVQASHILSRHG